MGRHIALLAALLAFGCGGRESPGAEAGSSPKLALGRAGDNPAAGGADQVLHASVVIRRSSDWQALVEGGYAAITGDLTIGAPPPPGLHGEPPLVTIGGRLTVGPDVGSLRLPALTTVKGEFRLEGSALRSLQLPSLAEVGGDLEILDNDALTTLVLPAFANVGGRLSIDDNDGLTCVSLPALTTVSLDLEVHNNHALTALDLSAPAAWYREARNHAAPTSVGLPALTSVGGDVVIQENALTSLVLPALTSTGGGVTFKDNFVLASLALPALTRVGGDVFVTDAIADLDLPALATVGGGVDIWDSKVRSSPFLCVNG